MQASPAISYPDVQVGRLTEVLYISILALVQFSFITDYLIVLPLGPTIIDTFDIMPGGYSILISGYTMSAAVSGFFSSFVIDRIERKKAIMICFALFSLGSLLSIVSTHFYFLVLSRIITGAFGGVLCSLIIVYLGDILPSSRLGRATSMVLLANSFGLVVSVPATLMIATKIGWKFPFIFLFVLNVFLFIISLFVLPRLEKNEKASRLNTNKVYVTVYNAKYIWPIVFMSLLTFAGGSTILPFLSTFVVTNLSFSTEDLSFLFFYGGLCSMIVGPATGALIDKYGKQNMFLLLNFFSIIPLILLTVYPLSSKEITLFITSLFFGLSTARHVSGMTLINSLFPKEIRGRYISINGSIQLMAGSIATFISGSLLYTENQMLMNFDVLGIIGICATIICIFTAFVIDD